MRLLIQRIGIGLLLLASTNASPGNIVDEAWGVITDPLKLSEGSRNALESVRELRNAVTALHSLQANFDEDIVKYLGDLDQKIENIKTGTEAVVTHTVAEITKLEKVVLADINSIIRETECAAVSTADDIFKKSFGDLWIPTQGKRVVQLPLGKERYWFFWERPAVIEIDLSSGPAPDYIFFEIENATITNLALATDDTPARVIVGAYGNLADLAKYTQCLYHGQEYEKKFARKYAEYNALVYAWNKSVKY